MEIVDAGSVKVELEVRPQFCSRGWVLDIMQTEMHFYYKSNAQLPLSMKVTSPIKTCTFLQYSGSRKSLSKQSSKAKEL